MPEALAQSDGCCRHNGQSGDDQDDERYNAGVSILLLLSPPLDGAQRNDRATVWQGFKVVSCKRGHSVYDLRIQTHGSVILRHGLHEHLQTAGYRCFGG